MSHSFSSAFGPGFESSHLAPAVAPTGGWGLAMIYDRYSEEKREREEEERQVQMEIRTIESKTDAEIARLMHQQMSFDARTQEMNKLEVMMKQFDDRRERDLAREFNADVAAAYDKAMNLGTFASAEAFERAMERAFEEEEFLLLAIATLH